MSPFPRAQREIHSVFTLCITPMSKKATQRRNPVAQKKKAAELGMQHLPALL
jgi:hypothetical protein